MLPDRTVEMTLRRAEIFEGLDEGQVSDLMAIVRLQQFQKGQYIFMIGDPADRLHVVLSGKVELTFPLSFGGVIRDVCVESKLPGSALGWSSLVRPFRFTLSARAVEPSELAAFLRRDLLLVVENDLQIAYALTRKIAEVMGRRLLQVQALWAREVQRAVTDCLGSRGTMR